MSSDLSRENWSRTYIRLSRVCSVQSCLTVRLKDIKGEYNMEVAIYGNGCKKVCKLYTLSKHGNINMFTPFLYFAAHVTKCRNKHDQQHPGKFLSPRAKNSVFWCLYQIKWLKLVEKKQLHWISFVCSVVTWALASKSFTLLLPPIYKKPVPLLFLSWNDRVSRPFCLVALRE